MKLIQASAVIESFTPDLQELIEKAGRVCYRSEERIAPGTAEKFITSILSNHHESVLEHGAITVRFINDRGVSHEEVRHRISSFSQESTRYCSYDKAKHGSEITVIDIRGGFPSMPEERFLIWHHAMLAAEQAYFALLAAGAAPQEARSVLPNSLKTELVWTANPREWRHVLRLRTSKAAHPQIREVMIPLLREFQQRWPAIFSDIKELS